VGTSIDTIVANFGGTPGTPGGADIIATSGGSWNSGASDFANLPGRAIDDPLIDFNGVTRAGTAGDDIVVGKLGIDTLRGEAGNDLLIGGSGNDAMNGGAGDDELVGGTGDDFMMSGGGNDTLRGDAGGDIMLAGAGRQEMHGGAGSDTFLVEAGAFFWGMPGSRAVITGADNRNVADGTNTVVLLVPAGVEIGDILAGLTASA
jgi:Ca2+-binding RTX toxin-like protein